MTRTYTGDVRAAGPDPQRAAPSWLRALARPLWRPYLLRLRTPAVAELVKFVGVGVFVTLLDLGVANALHFGVGLGPTLSKALATVIATAVSYLGNRLWAFGDRVDRDARQHRVVGVFVLLNALGLVITLLPVDIAHDVLGNTSPVAFNVSGLLGNVAATAFRFWSYRRFVFPARAPSTTA